MDELSPPLKLSTAADEGTGSDFATACNLAGVDFRQTKERIHLFLNDELSGSFAGTMNKPSLHSYEIQQKPRQVNSQNLAFYMANTGGSYELPPVLEFVS